MIQSKPWAIAAQWVLIYLSWVVLVTQCGCAAAPRGAPRAPLERADLAAVVEVTCAGSLYRGSAALVSDDIAITAMHVVAHPLFGACAHKPQLVLRLADGTDVAAEFERGWVRRDVARLRLVRRDFKPPNVISPRVAAPRLGEVVCSASAWPERQHSCGIVQSVDEGEVVFSAPVLRGNSGAGLYDQRGALVGIVTSGWFVPGTDISLGSGAAAIAREEYVAP